MASQAPLFNQSQSSPTTNLSVVTTIADQILNGTLASNIVDVQVSLNGEPFRADPTLVSFDQGIFTLPNTSVFPEGLGLDFGTNTVRIRAVDVTGSISPISTATITLLRDGEVDLISEPPTGIRIRRRRDKVEVVFAEQDIEHVKGYNVYASSEAGGGTVGYYRLNRDLINTIAFSEERTQVVQESDTTSSGSRVTLLDNLYGQIAITTDQKDFVGNTLEALGTQTVDASLAGPKIKVSVTVESVETTNYLQFTHDREATAIEGTVNNEFFFSVPTDEPLFYVITTVVSDPATNTEVESAHSDELVGLPLTIDTQITEIPRRTRFDVSESYIDSILRIDNEISVIPGSVVRDIFIDPFSTEAERLYFVSDYISRSQSFLTLLQVDASTSYKEALAASLGINSITDVQPIIDDSFEKLAGNVQVTRQGSESSRGEVTFFTPSAPQQDLTIEAGTTVSTDEGISFTVTSTTTLPLDALSSYFNVQRQRYEITATIQADVAGSASNVATNQIKSVIGGVGNLQVVNLEATQFGTDEESNADLAERAILALSSVDAGTDTGYLSTALKQIEVFRAKVVSAGQEYMARDYDTLRQKHVGGKVDLWIQGENLVTVTDKFALRFDVERDVRFFLDSNPSDLIFIADDARLTPGAPITTLLGLTPQEQSNGLGFRNSTTGNVFDLSGATILDYNRIQLDNTIPQPAVSASDVVSGDFKFQQSDQFVFTRQPVSQVNSVASLLTGQALAEGTDYALYQTQDPLLEGKSTLAQDYLQVSTKGISSSLGVVQINDERHVLIGQTPDELHNLGASSLTVRVFSLDRLTEYAGPSSPTPDFFLVEGNSTSPVELVRNPGGQISNGLEVSVDYEHDENFTVDYVVNEVLQRVQEAVNTQRHITADVLVKEAIANPIDLELTLVLMQGAVKAVVDSLVRTRVSQYMNSRGVGEPVHQSDIVRIIEGTSGVDYVVVPFARLSHADRNLLVRESLSDSFVYLDQNPLTKFYVLQDALNYATVTGGGFDSSHQGIFQDGLLLPMAKSYSDLKVTTGAAFISGAQGLILAGYSDDVTLTGLGFNTQKERDEQRLALTANRVFLSLPLNDSPENHSYQATYQVSQDTSVRSTIELTEVSYAELGDLTITFRTSGN